MTVDLLGGQFDRTKLVTDDTNSHRTSVDAVGDAVAYHQDAAFAVVAYACHLLQHTPMWRIAPDYCASCWPPSAATTDHRLHQFVRIDNCVVIR